MRSRRSRKRGIASRWFPSRYPTTGADTSSGLGSRSRRRGRDAGLRLRRVQRQRGFPFSCRQKTIEAVEVRVPPAGGGGSSKRLTIGRWRPRPSPPMGLDPRREVQSALAEMFTSGSQIGATTLTSRAATEMIPLRCMNFRMPLTVSSRDGSGLPHTEASRAI
jgi:hypothetical protein